jgi:hypothetical protein
MIEENMHYHWMKFRYRLASWIVRFNIEEEVEAAYDAGLQWGRAERAKGLPND